MRTAAGVVSGGLSERGNRHHTPTGSTGRPVIEVALLRDPTDRTPRQLRQRRALASCDSPAGTVVTIAEAPVRERA